MSFQTNTPRGFTLIELLVVISIIGMLSSVILVSLTSARDKAKIAAGQQFASHNYQGKGTDALIYWNMDETSGAVIDHSGNNIHGTITGATRSTTQVYNAQGSSLAVSSSGSYINNTNAISSSFNVDKNTVSIWIYPTSFGTNQVAINGSNNLGGRVFNIQFYNNTILVGKDNCYWQVPNTLQLNKWQNLTYTYAGGTSFSVYLNGNPIAGGSSYTGVTSGCNTNTTLTNIRVGEYIGGNGYNIIGFIDDVIVYQSALAYSEVQKIYAAGQKTHEFAVVYE